MVISMNQKSMLVFSILGVCIILFLVEFFCFKEHIVYANNSDLAIYIDGVRSSSVPSKNAGYKFDDVNIFCSNTKVSWDNESWSPIVTVNNGNYAKVHCNLSFKLTDLYLFNHGDIYGDTATWPGAYDGVDYITLGDTIHYDDNSTSEYGNAVIGFNDVIDFTNFTSLDIEFTVNSISNSSANLPFWVQVYVLNEDDYYETIPKSELDTISVAKKNTSFYQTGSYKASLDVSSLKGNYNVAVLIHSHQYTNGLLNLDVFSLVLRP
mgnify:FL=1